MTLQPKTDLAVTEFAYSNEVIELFKSAAVRNVNEAITVLFHSFLLESGFRPKDVPYSDIYKLMPKNWNAKGIFNIKYSHYCCPSFTCYMKCVPLYNNVSIHGIVCDTVCSESVDLKMNLSKYLKQRKDFSNICEVFSSVDELSRYFKDNFCLPLLNLLHETTGERRLSGFPGLYDELKMLILTLLPVDGVLSLSSVNKNLHKLANTSILWKYLFKRDFARDGIPDVQTSTETDWKELYKKEYIKRNRKPEPRYFRIPYYRMPRIFDMGPDLDSDLHIYFDPPFPGSSSFFPPLHRPQLPPPFFRRFYQN